jgi:GR25 family glycosyltransferase involved in LPS biosynthesis
VHIPALDFASLTLLNFLCIKTARFIPHDTCKMKQVMLILMLITSLVIGCILVWYDEIYGRRNEAFANPSLNPSMFDVYVINLDRSPERLAAFYKYYNETDLGHITAKVERVSGVDGTLLKLDDHVSESAMAEMENAKVRGWRRRYHRELTPGAVGCYLSHESIFRKVANGSKPYAIVFEDDAVIQPDIFKQLSAALTPDLPDNWDMLLMSCLCRQSKEGCAGPIYNDITDFWRLHAYIVTKAGAETVCKHLDGKLIEQQLDAELSSMASCGLLRILCLTSDLAQQDYDMESTIQVPADSARFELDKKVQEACDYRLRPSRHSST